MPNLQNDMENAKATAKKEMENLETKKPNAICTCPECGYVGEAVEFEESEPKEEGMDEGSESKPAVEVEIAMGKRKPLMSAREAVVNALESKR